jgi:ubiquinone/menaquinone biosynthesis C-methylase UbiE
MHLNALRVLLTGSFVALGVSLAAQPQAPGHAGAGQHKPDHMQHSFSDAEKYAKEFDDPSRDAWQMPGRVIEALGLRAGQSVADIGAGTGYYTMRLAARLGPASLIYAQETDPAELALLGARADRQRLLNVIPVQGYPSDPALPPGSVDVALLSHSYHQVPEPYLFLYRLAGALAPGGRVGVIGFDRQAIQYGLPPAALECEFEAVGYRTVALYRLTPGEAYLAVFEAPDRLPEPSAIEPCGPPEPAPDP